MANKKWYQQLFENYGKQYDKESFTQGTHGECDFIEKEIGFDKTQKILDVGCGTGRHAIELVKRGYHVSGFDLSEAQIKRAKEKAETEGLSIDFQVLDACKPHFNNAFDLVIMLCEGGFPLMETDEKNFEILKHATAALKENGKLVFTTLNGLFPVFNSVEQFLADQSQAENATYHNNTFDIMTFRDYNTTEITDDSGKKISLECNERYYIPSEITWLLKTLHYRTIEIFGAKIGAYSRNDKLTINDYEMLVIAQK